MLFFALETMVRENGMKKIVRYIFLILVLGYLLIYLTALPFVLRAKDVFMGKQVEIEDRLSRYKWKHVGEDAERTIKIIPYFIVHNFRQGSIWVYYDFEAYDQNGDCVGGSKCPSRWNIRRTQKGWEVYEIIEAP